MLTIGVVCLDELVCLRACLATVSKYTTESVQIVVVDRGSQDGTAEYLDSIESIQLVVRDGASHAEAVNWIFEEFGGSDVLLVGADVAIESPDWIARLRSAVMRHGKVGLVTGQILFPDGRIANRGRHIISGLGMAQQHANLGYMTWPSEVMEQVVEVDSVSGDLVYCTREVVESICGMDPSFTAEFGGYDDLAMQVRLAGYKVFCDHGVRAVRYSPVTPVINALPFAEPEDLHVFAAQTRDEFVYVHAEDWEAKWGWNPKYPDLGEIRRLYDHTELCWQIGDSMRMEFAEGNPRIDLAITTHNNLAQLRRTMDCLRQTDYPAVSVCVVDNGSDDGTREYLEGLVDAFPFPLQLLPLPVNIGVEAGFSLAMAEGTGELVARLSDDIELPSDWLQSLVRAFRERPYAGAVSPVMLASDVGASSGEVRSPEEKLGHLHRVVRLQSGCNLYRRDALSLCGLFDSRFVGSPSLEADLQGALAQSGFEVLIDGRVAGLSSSAESASQSLALSESSVDVRHQPNLLFACDAWEVLGGGLDRSREGSILSSDLEATQFYLASNYSHGLPAQLHNRRAADQVDAMLAATRIVLAVDGPCSDYWSEVYLHGRRLFEEGSLEPALAVFTVTINLFPWSARAYRASASCLEQLGRLEEAEVFRLRCNNLSGGEAQDRDLSTLVSRNQEAEPVVSVSMNADPFRVLLINTNAKGAFDGSGFLQNTARVLRAADVEVEIAWGAPEDVYAYDLVHLFHCGDSLRLRQVTRYLRLAGVVAPLVISPLFKSARRAEWLARSMVSVFRSAQSEPELDRNLRALALGKLELDGSSGRSVEAPSFDDADKFLRQAIDDSDGIVVYSRLEQDSLCSTIQTTRPVWSVASPLNPLLMDPGDPRVFADAYGVKDFVLSVGEICPSGNQLMLVQAMRGTGIPLVIVGRGDGGEYERELRRRADEDVIFLDHLESDLMSSALSAAQVFVAPSWQGADASLALTAAFANCEVVAGELSAAAELLAEIGYSCDPADVDSIKRVVLEAMEKRSTRSKRRDRWRRSRRENMAALKIARELLVCYQRAISLSHASA